MTVQALQDHPSGLKPEERRGRIEALRSRKRVVGEMHDELALRLNELRNQLWLIDFEMNEYADR